MGKDTAPVYRAAWSALARDLGAANLKFVDRQPSAAFGYELYVGECKDERLWFMALPYLKIIQVMLNPATAVEDFKHISNRATDIQESLANSGQLSCPTEEMLTWLRRHRIFFRLGSVLTHDQSSEIRWEKWEGHPAYPVLPRRSA